jgi:acetylornithine deacetylase/succinyl-diaminopimelate desuccinylase-like protein
MASSLDDLLHAGEQEALDGLIRFLNWPSVSTDPTAAVAVRDCAAWLAGELEDAGLEHVQMWRTAGHPVVYADWLHVPDAPTALVYGHYDVQPVEPLDLWESPPFQAVIRSGNLYGRGSADDKGQVYMHVVALRALLQAEGRLPINVKLLIEGEEEVGSPNLEAAIETHLDELKADLVVISDTSMYGPGQPALNYGLRGLAYFQVDVEGANTDLHSGGYGGAVPNPLQALSALLAGLKDEHSRITLPGFYDDVRTISYEERTALQALGDDEEALRADLGLAALDGEEGYSRLERIWTRPSLDINGIWGGYSGPGSKTVLPAKGGAKLSFRLVPDQDPTRVAALLHAYLHDHCPPGIRLTLTQLAGSALPWLAERGQPTMRAAARALARAFGREPVYIRSGGSIPVVMTFDKLLGVPVIMLGVSLPDSHAHAPNERFPLDCFHGGARAAAYLWQELAAIGPA